MDTIITAILLGIVEGLTEFIPVSSTGHLILASEIFGYDAQVWKVFNVVIQLGAILAVVVLYWRTFWAVGMGLLKWRPESVAFLCNVLLGFLPSAVLGFALKDYIDILLGSPMVVAWALLLGHGFYRFLWRLSPPGTVQPASAYFAAAIGGASEMALLAERHHAQVDRVAAAHSLRVLMVSVYYAPNFCT